MTGARIFVGLVFVAIGACFIASSAVMIEEFRTTGWFTLLVAHSHLFFFFPVFGILALAAFYFPSVVFTHLYWSHLRFGRVRFLLGLVAVAALTYGVGWWLDAKPRAVWEASPRALAADRGDPAGCAGTSTSACRRAPIMETLVALREEGRKRVGLSKFARSCAVDPMLEVPEEMLKLRYCFPAKATLQGAACCTAQARFADAVARLQADPAQRSLTARMEAYFLHVKIFFVLIVVAIGLLLAMWRNKRDLLYKDQIPAIERGVIIGAFAMLFWPMMDYGYQQTANVLFGRADSGPQFRLSLVIAPWALLLLFYFLRRLGKQGEIIGQVSGVVAAGVAVLRYDALNDWAVRLLGVGTNEVIVGVMVAIAFAGFVALVWPWRLDHIARSTPPSG
jgi:hypothetical protein